MVDHLKETNPTLVAELIRKAKRDGERPAEATGDADVLSDTENEGIALHLLADALANRLSNAHLAHRRHPVDAEANGTGPSP